MNLKECLISISLKQLQKFRPTLQYNGDDCYQNATKIEIHEGKTLSILTMYGFCRRSVCKDFSMSKMIEKKAMVGKKIKENDLQLLKCRRIVS